MLKALVVALGLLLAIPALADDTACQGSWPDGRAFLMERHAQIVELTGGKVKLYMGSYDNIKITNPADLAIAETLWKRRIV